MRMGRARVWGATLALISTFLLVVGEIQPAFAIDYTITYDANANYVGAVNQTGLTSGSVPTSPAQAGGTTYTVMGVGSLARAGFTFAGWNTANNGTGTTYQPGSSFILNSNQTLYAIWTIPVAARLIGNGGNLITVADTNTVTNGSLCIAQGVRGITSDGTYIYYRPSANLGYICKATPAGLLVSVHAVSGLASVPGDQIAIVYASGCLLLRKNAGATLDSIYCISLSDWSLNSISLPAGYPLPSGGTWLYGNFIQFPDGRVGSVSTSYTSASFPGGQGTGAGQCPSGMYCKRLRLYSITGTGPSLTTTFSTDFVLADTVNSWPSDDHGIATDGTYLYQVRHARGYKVWALSATGASYLVFNGDSDGTATTPSCGASTGVTGTYCQITYPVTGATGGPTFANGTYLGRAHGLNKYLIGDYDGSSQFWLSNPATPPAGPGNPDLTPPAFTSGDTFTVTENIATSVNAASIVVNDSATIAIAVGIDGALFNLIVTDTATAVIRFKASPDYEAPTDVGANNIYNITINATDSAGNTGSRTIAIVVTNLNESSTVTPPSVSGSVYKGVVITVSVTVNAPGLVRFYLKGKRIAGCLARPTSGSYPNYTATCQWKPPVMGQQFLTAELTPTSNTFSSSTSAVGTFWVLKRTTLR